MPYYVIASVIIVAAIVFAATRQRRPSVDSVSTEWLSRLRAGERASM